MRTFFPNFEIYSNKNISSKYGFLHVMENNVNSQSPKTEDDDSNNDSFFSRLKDAGVDDNTIELLNNNDRLAKIFDDIFGYESIKKKTKQIVEEIVSIIKAQPQLKTRSQRIAVAEAILKALSSVGGAMTNFGKFIDDVKEKL